MRKVRFSICMLIMLLLISFVLLQYVQAQVPGRPQIAFSSDRDGNPEIYVMDSDGRNPRNLTNNPAADWWPSWFDPLYALFVSPAGKAGATWGWVKHIQ